MKRFLPPSAPFLAFGGAWAAYALLFPFYRPVHLVPAALVSLAAGAAAGRFTEKPEPAPEPEPVITRVQEQAAQLDSYARELRAIAGTIKDPEVSRYASSICDTMTKMAENIEANPIDSKKARSFIKHYIPTVLTVFERYANLEAQNISGGNIGQSMDEIEASLARIDSLFRKQLDDMFDDDALDIKTDISVLEQLMSDLK